MGSWTYYLAAMPATEVAARIQPAHSIREAKGLEDFLQRELKERATKIAQYLITVDARLFNALVVGVFGAVPEWFPIDLVKSTVLSFSDSEKESITDTIGLLRFTGDEQMFAIDGQHRAEAVRRALQVLDAGAERARRDEIPVVFVAHVDDAEGKRRSRRLFADINKRAVPVSRGDLAVIDEEDLSCVAARQVYASKGALRGLIAVTERPEMLAGESSHFTNLLTLVDVCKKLRKLIALKRGKPKSDPENVHALTDAAMKFVVFLLEHVPDLADCLRRGSPSIGTMREKRRHLLFRPIGLVLAAEVYVVCSQRGLLAKYGAWLAHHDLAITSPLFRGVIWERERVVTRGRGLAARLVEREIGALRQAELTQLLSAYRKHLSNPKAILPKLAARKSP